MYNSQMQSKVLVSLSKEDVCMASETGFYLWGENPVWIPEYGG